MVRPALFSEASESGYRPIPLAELDAMDDLTRAVTEDNEVTAYINDRPGSAGWPTIRVIQEFPNRPMEHVLAHETLHQVLARDEGPNTSRALDAGYNLGSLHIQRHLKAPRNPVGVGTSPRSERLTERQRAVGGAAARKQMRERRKYLAGRDPNLYESGP